MDELISAIITTYKRPPRVVKRAVESVLSQTYKNIEIIVVDDSPSEYQHRSEVKEIVCSMGNNIKYIPHLENKGACAARNTGLENAGGKYVAFLDDDDEWLPEKISIQKEKLDNSDAALVYCGSYTVYEESGFKKENKTIFKSGMIFDSLILQNIVGSNSFPLIKRSVLNELGGFDISMKAAQDLELWLRIARKYKIDYVKQPLVNYYVHAGEQITKNYSNKVEAYERLHELNKDYLEKHSKAFSIRLLKMAIVCSHVDLKRARSIFIEAIKLYPFLTKNLLKAFKWLYIMPLKK